MLELKNIRKSYKTGSFIQHALKGINLSFGSKEFVSILGVSGSGKTTLLNIIGGLDRYDSGDLIINGKSTKKFNDQLWDAYRNNCIGFIFQSYNLINHLTILQNVEISLTLSGVGERARKKRALEALKRVGLLEHSHKKPNELSGGQMQRVAIARALVNDPQVILADEPTGALDTKTSKQIMDLIKEISKEKLVIMVTHNPELAKEYSSRIIELKDGEVVKDSKPKEEEKLDDNIKIKKTKMGFLAALSLSFNNIKTKKGRTLLTSFASSIGVIGICLILSLSNGMDKQIDKYEEDSLANFPLMVSASTISLSEEQIKSFNSKMNSYEEFSGSKMVYPFDLSEFNLMHTNNLTDEYIDYVKKIDSSLINGISFARLTNFNMLIKNGDGVKYTDLSSLQMHSLPLTFDKESFTKRAYNVIGGKEATEYNELMLLVDNKNRISKNVLMLLGIEKDEVPFNEIIGKEIKIVLNNEYYNNYNGMYFPSKPSDELYNNKNNITLKIVGIIRNKEEGNLGEVALAFASNENMQASNSSRIMATGAILYNESLVEKVIEINSKSNIVSAQKNTNRNILTGLDLSESDKTYFLSMLGGSDNPYVINIYSKDFDSKNKVEEYLDKYNEGKEENERIIYNDLASTITSLSENIMDAVTYVLIAFSAVSLVVSSIMIGIITYTSVLERTKEIGVLRALGARKKDISRVFNAEVFIIGLTSGLLGIIISRILIIFINMLLFKLVEIKNVAVLNPLHALVLIIVSLSLTLIGGAIPSKIASRKDPVVALRTE